MQAQKTPGPDNKIGDCGLGRYQSTKQKKKTKKVYYTGQTLWNVSKSANITNVNESWKKKTRMWCTLHNQPKVYHKNTL